MNQPEFRNRIFSIKSQSEFSLIALEIFQYQYNQNHVYQRYCDLLGNQPGQVDSVDTIPFLPIRFFRDYKIITSDLKEQVVFTSSGTTGSTPSSHFVADTSLYRESFTRAFKQFYGEPSQYGILALLPSYMQSEGSSLVFMVNELIRLTQNPLSGFFLHDPEGLIKSAGEITSQGKKVFLLGVSYALLDLIETADLDLRGHIVMETGGMKGRRKEIIRNELHEKLMIGFNVGEIHSEYGMTEMLSQAYSCSNGFFKCPMWMDITIRDLYDPFSTIQTGVTGGVNVVDLANLNSCSFIATDDLGRKRVDGTFEIMGRTGSSEIRGCNLMVG
jgi:phenylacetate-coenzyme A ligase PaaK-like adenylate-forming protein